MILSHSVLSACSKTLPPLLLSPLYRECNGPRPCLNSQNCSGRHEAWHHHLWWGTRGEGVHSHTVSPGQQHCGLSRFFWSLALLQSGSDLLHFIHFHSGLFFLILLCCLVSPALVCCFLFSSAFFPFWGHTGQTALVSVTLYCAGVAELRINWPPGDAPCAGSQPAQGSINSANSSPCAGTRSDWEMHRSTIECSQFLTGTSWGLKQTRTG